MVTDPVGNQADDRFGAARTLIGTPVVGGLVYGPVVRPGDRPDFGELDEEHVDDTERAVEAERLAYAAETVAQRLADRASQSTGVAAEVLTATAGLARDRGWIGAASSLISSGSAAVPAAVAATEQFAQMFSKVGGMMAERITDLNDVRDRVIAELLGLPEPGIPVPDEPSILCADDLAPADTAGLDPQKVIALVTGRGGPTSHTAIIARQLGIPCVVAVSDLDSVPSGALVYVDGDGGTVGVDPDRQRIEPAVTEAAEAAERVSRWRGPGRTADGTAVAVLANVADGASARTAAERSVEGVGLFRTELAFLDRAAEPSVAEQATLYREVLRAFEGRKVVIRTLDAGSDKPLAFVEQPSEANPALGVRGNRIERTHPGIRASQLAAIAEASCGIDAQVWVMAPMIATVDEAREFAARVREKGLVAGVMVEIPSVALLAEQILREVDFVSIGTNDLTQYTMAADRMSPQLADLTDPWQPAVLKLIAQVGVAGEKLGKPVGVCGEAAADPLLACVLVGCGATSLSAAPAAAAAVGDRLSRATQDQCARAATAALNASSAAAARAAARAILDS